MAQYFTLPEAERLLPRVERYLRDALLHREEAQKAHEELQATSEHIRMAGGVRVNPGALLAVRARFDTSAAALKEAVEQIEQTGAVLKDLDIGLIDFMSRFRNQDVCLCWKLGESGIGFWHGAEEGFRGRKPIDREFIEGHTSDQRSPGRLH
ncbi:MAG: DUF2203 domain-containing protein [Bryobacterales bacterium]|nr:DUF2203 domain-containing protein [Bryobacterales bacterium]MBV9399778.1 DUF2203 domain-containing protein [Bryobacterales bacterium]